MEVCHDVYIEEGMNDNSIHKSIKKIKNNKPDLDLFLVCVMEGSGFVMEIFHYDESQKPLSKNKRYLVIGIAGNKKAAINLSVKILQDCVLNKIALSSNEIFEFFNSFQNKKQ